MPGTMVDGWVAGSGWKQVSTCFQDRDRVRPIAVVLQPAARLTLTFSGSHLLMGKEAIEVQMPSNSVFRKQIWEYIL
ncbi:unnamed protein product [Danaus chrysippus]|uniref:(African queen) hypothetical protein n=1 Tax=Danaus chrysippus TaxID=151541 RepID=A0A8J2QFN8_9NEOP|nr:unnamed protein product [Danaus chrysippus]